MTLRAEGPRVPWCHPACPDSHWAWLPVPPVPQRAQFTSPGALLFAGPAVKCPRSTVLLDAAGKALLATRRGVTGAQPSLAGPPQALVGHSSGDAPDTAGFDLGGRSQRRGGVQRAAPRGWIQLFIQALALSAPPAQGKRLWRDLPWVKRLNADTDPPRDVDVVLSCLL